MCKYNHFGFMKEKSLCIPERKLDMEQLIMNELSPMRWCGFMASRVGERDFFQVKNYITITITNWSRSSIL